MEKLSSYLAIYWEGQPNNLQLLLRAIESSDTSAVENELFSAYLSNDLQFDSSQSYQPEDGAYEPLLTEVGRLTSAVNKWGNDSLRLQLHTLQVHLQSDLFMQDTLKHNWLSIPVTDRKYRLATLQFQYLQIRLKVACIRHQSRHISQTVLEQEVMLVLDRIKQQYMGGFFNSYRKNRVTREYPLLDQILTSHTLGPAVINRVFDVSRMGEYRLNRSMVNSGDIHSKLFYHALYHLDPLELRLYSGTLSSIDTLLLLTRKRAVLRDKYELLSTSLKSADDNSSFPVSDGKTLIRYFDSGTNLFQLVETSEGLNLTSYSKKKLLPIISEVKEAFNRPATVFLGQHSQNLKSHLADLYGFLFGQNGETTLTKEVMVDPDGMVIGLPMEILIDQTGHYLLDHHLFSYSNGRSIRAQRLFDKHMAVIGPHFQNEQLQLEWAEKEVEYIAGSFHHTSILNAFSELETQSFELIHLATHQLWDPSGRPVLLLPDSIFRNDFFHLNAPPSQLILSACSSSGGEPVSGEYNKSFQSRGHEVGVNSVISSLWDVEDHATADIMDRYYRYFADGINSAEALNRSKKSYVDHADQFYQHPVFWASFTHSGDHLRLSNSMTFPYFWFISIMALGFLLMIIYLPVKVRISY
ncbi:CHAT domain-containing protein [Marinoscillum sp.]|uniref:CHAT domain-containing protein n=1 Tax=Marinoscillum sp. TaxID=2024838 RepID=UPI003BAC0B93